MQIDNVNLCSLSKVHSSQRFISDIYLLLTCPLLGHSFPSQLHGGGQLKLVSVNLAYRFGPQSVQAQCVWAGT